MGEGACLRFTDAATVSPLGPHPPASPVAPRATSPCQGEGSEAPRPHVFNHGLEARATQLPLRPCDRNGGCKMGERMNGRRGEHTPMRPCPHAPMPQPYRRSPGGWSEGVPPTKRGQDALTTAGRMPAVLVRLRPFRGTAIPGRDSMEHGLEARATFFAGSIHVPPFFPVRRQGRSGRQERPCPHAPMLPCPNRTDAVPAVGRYCASGASAASRCSR